MERFEKSILIIGIILFVLGCSGMIKTYIHYFGFSKEPINQPVHAVKGQLIRAEFTAETNLYYDVCLSFSDVYPAKKMDDLLGGPFGKATSPHAFNVSWEVLSDNSVIATSKNKSLGYGGYFGSEKISRTLCQIKGIKDRTYMINLDVNKLSPELLKADPYLEVKALPDQVFEDVPFAFALIRLFAVNFVFMVTGLLIVAFYRVIRNL